MSRVARDVQSTPHFAFLHGAYQLSHWHVPYFSLTMSVEEAAENLHLTSDIPGSETIGWRLDELYQRDLDWRRVEKTIVKYLQNPAVPQFFNSLTIALLPYDDLKGELVSGFDAAAFDPPPIDLDVAKTLEVGPISLGFWDDWTSADDPEFRTGVLRWNRKQLFGVAIDGQHRLAALKTLNSPGSNRALAMTRIPVIVLVFDERVGFSRPGDASDDEVMQVHLLRRLFIDLNKHAKTVSRARQLLLDDWDPYARCVRELIGNELRDDLSELHESPPMLPLSLVDWHTEQAKFDTGPYVATVLGLDWIVAKVFGGTPVSDFTDYRAMRSQLGRINRALGIELHEASRRLEEIAEFELTPFTYTEEEIEEIGEAFASTWSWALIHLLTALSPYADLIALRTSQGTFGLEFQHWYELNSQLASGGDSSHLVERFNQFLGRMERRSEHPISRRAFELWLSDVDALKDSNLAFNVVFQRALILGFLQVRRVDQSEIEALRDEYWEDFGQEVDFDDFAESDGDGDASDADGVPDQIAEEDSSQVATQVEARARDYVAALNALISRWPEFLDVRVRIEHGGETSEQFWVGTLLKPEGSIDFTQAASGRAEDLLFWVAAVSFYVSESGVEPSEEAFEDFWSRMFDDDAGPLLKRMRRSVTRFVQPEGSPARRILAAHDLAFDEDDAWYEAEWRVRAIWERFAGAAE